MALDMAPKARLVVSYFSLALLSRTCSHISLTEWPDEAAPILPDQVSHSEGHELPGEGSLLLLR